jgi:hypothetical protein
MDFLNNIPINSTGGFIGLALLVIGGFMVLAGVGIISIQQVTVRQGRATWAVGLVLAVGGVFLLYPEFSAPNAVPDSPAAAEQASPGAEVAANPAGASGASPAATQAAGGSSSELSDWSTLAVTIPGSGLWQMEDGRYTATGAMDTIAWSQDLFTGDLELTFEVESPDDYSSANIILYGNGGALSPGNLIFVLASDLQAIQADTIYEGGAYLYSSLDSLAYAGEKHTVLISVHDRTASVFIDGVEIGRAGLDDRINTSGKIGLFKWGGIENVTFSNILVRSQALVE